MLQLRGSVYGRCRRNNTKLLASMWPYPPGHWPGTKPADSTPRLPKMGTGTRLPGVGCPVVLTEGGAPFT